MRGKKTSGVWFLMTLLFSQKAPASVHHGLPSLPPSLLKSLTFSTAVLVLIIVVVISVQDRSVRVGVIGLVFPLAFVL